MAYTPQRLVHGLGVQSLHHANASPPGGKVCLEHHQLTIKKERDVKNEKWLLVLKQRRRLALSFQRKNALHPSGMQGLLPRASLKIQISLFGVLGITKHHQHPCVLRTTSIPYSILLLVPQTTKEVTCSTALHLKPIAFRMMTDQRRYSGQEVTLEHDICSSEFDSSIK